MFNALAIRGNLFHPFQQGFFILTTANGWK